MKGKPDHSAPMRTFLRWMRVQGLSKHDCDFIPAVFPDSGRGAMARRNVAAGSCVVSVPEHVILTMSAAQNLISDFGIDECVSDSSKLAVFILYQKLLGEESFWSKFFAVLPHQYSTTLNFSAEDLKLLPSACQDRAHALQMAIRRDFIIICESRKQLKRHSCPPFEWMDFVWAYSTVCTRAVSFPGKDLQGR